MLNQRCFPARGALFHFLLNKLRELHVSRGTPRTAVLVLYLQLHACWCIPSDVGGRLKLAVQGFSRKDSHLAAPLSQVEVSNVVQPVALRGPDGGPNELGTSSSWPLAQTTTLI